MTASSKVTYLGGASGAANGFFYGYCTWWVAHKRYVPWRGNAAQWWWNARPFGYAEGSTPRVGAIMVMGAGPWSPEGHVAYVEQVRPDGSFVVSEMNWGRWGVVDLRTITSLKGVLGFIY
jgi:surface antigen